MSKAVKVNKVINTTRNMYLGKYSFSLQAIRLTCPAEPILRPTANSFTTSRPSHQDPVHVQQCMHLKACPRMVSTVDSPASSCYWNASLSTHA